MRHDVAMTDHPERDRWSFDGQHYQVTKFSDVATRDGYGFELAELGPNGRGTVLEAFWDDTTGLFTFTALTQGPLPFRAVEQFVSDAAIGVPPSA